MCRLTDVDDSADCLTLAEPITTPVIFAYEQVRAEQEPRGSRAFPGHRDDGDNFGASLCYCEERYYGMIYSQEEPDYDIYIAVYSLYYLYILSA